MTEPVDWVTYDTVPIPPEMMKDAAEQLRAMGAVPDGDSLGEPMTPFQSYVNGAFDGIGERLAELETRIDAQGQVLDALKDGVNTIGSMMNSVAEAFDQIMAQVKTGGLAGLMGGMLGGGKKTDG